MLYQISNGAVVFGDNVILHDIYFEIRNTEKIAVVGRNGCGKTTLLKLISGEVELYQEDGDEGTIAMAGKPQIGYLKQIAFDDPTITLEKEIRKVFAPMIAMKKQVEDAAKALDTDHSEEKVKAYTNLEEKFREAGGYYFEKEYEVLIRKFGFSEEERKKPLSEFSGGQQTKIAFIKLLLSKPDILLLDEPTNHLDITTIEWLEGYLKNYPKAVVVVSHDRMFLDNIVDVVYEIEYGVLKRYPGNYSNFVSELLNKFNLNSKVIKREKNYMVYVKEAEKISDFLRVINAYNGVMYFEDIRIYRDHKNMTNRLNNCEQANMDKVFMTATRQLNDIKVIRDNDMLDVMDEKILEVIKYRELYPEASLQELSEIMSNELGYEITKSGLNHRFRKIKDIVSKLGH